MSHFTVEKLKCNFVCAETRTRRYRASISYSSRLCNICCFWQISVVIAGEELLHPVIAFNPAFTWVKCQYVSGVVSCLLPFINMDTTVKCICNGIWMLLVVISLTVEIAL